MPYADLRICLLKGATVKDYSKALCDISCRIWDYAELKFNEKKSAEELAGLLEQEGFKVTRGIAGMETAFTAKWGTGKPVIGFLGEYDALSGLSQEAGVTEKKVRPGTGNGHGCGHNLLGSAAAGAALMLRDYLKESGRPGTVMFFGCPGEEGGSGKTYMARDGVFDGLDCALTWHPGGGNAVMTGAFMANCQVYYRFRGRSAHAAAAPHLGRSALDAVELMDVGVNYMREHMEPTDRIHYAILDTGGTSPNVVQNHAEVLYLIRSTDTEKVNALYERVCNIARGAALMTETKVEILFDKAVSSTLSNAVLEDVLYQSMKKVPLPEYTAEELDFAKAIKDSYKDIDPAGDLSISFLPNRERRRCAALYRESPMMDFVIEHHHLDVFVPGSSDVGDASRVVPTAQFVAATFTPGTPGHSWQMVAQGKNSIAMKGMLYAAKVLAEAGKQLIEDPELLKKAKEEFIETTEGKPYLSPIPKHIKPHRNVEELKKFSEQEGAK